MKKQASTTGNEIPRLPKIQHHKASGQARVRWNGKDTYLGKFGSNEANEAYRRFCVALLQGRTPTKPDRVASPRSELTIGELVAAGLDRAKNEYTIQRNSPGEYDRFREAVPPLLEFYRSHPAENFGPKALKEVRDEMVRRGWNRGTVNGQISRIKRIFRWAVEDEILSGSVFQALSAVRGLSPGQSLAPEPGVVEPVDSDRVNAVLPFVSRHVAAMIRVQELTGMRPGEVVIMRMRDIDRTGEVWHYRPIRHKTQRHGHERKVPLGPKAQEILNGFVKADPDAFLFDPRDAENERHAAMRNRRRTPVQPSQRNRKHALRSRAPEDHYTTESYRRAIARACAKAKVKTWHPHQLRHNAATRISKEHDIETARVVLGHKSPKITATYAAADQSRADEAMKRIG